MNRKIEQLKGLLANAKQMLRELEKEERDLLFEPPDEWRLGQYFFNFFEWLTTKGYSSNQSHRMADIFHIPDKEFVRLLKEYSEEIK